MCGICNLFRGSRSNRSRRCACEACDRSAYWREPRMTVHCASGLGSASSAPCGTENGCGCCYERRESNCYDYDNDAYDAYRRRRNYHDHESDCGCDE